MFLIKSNKLLILVTTLCIMVTNNSKASDNIEVLESNNIEHSSSIIEKNMESVVIDNTHNISESHNNDELNNNNSEHNNGEINHSDNNVKHNNNEGNHNNIKLEYSNSEVKHDKANLNHSDNNINHEDINNENNNNNSVNEHTEQNNNDDVVLEVKEEGVQAGNEREESLCNNVKKICSGIIVVPVSFCSYVISLLNFGIEDTARTMLHDASIAVIKPAFDNTIKSVWNGIIIIGSKTTNLFGNAKSWLLNRISH